MAWTIEYAERATRTLQKLDRATSRRIVDYMEQRVAASPDPRLTGKSLAGNLKGYWRYRVGDYRIICHIRDRQLIILVVEIAHRREVYRK